MPEYISVGKIVAVFGLKGEVILQHILGRKTSLKGVKAVFTQDKNDSWFPWFIKEAKARTNKEILLAIEDIETPEAAKVLVQRTIWLLKEDVEHHTAPASVLSLIGFTVIQNRKKLGEITEVIEQPNQLLCTVIIAGKEALIPLHQETLLKVDKVKKYVFVDLPDGLLELYL